MKIALYITWFFSLVATAGSLFLSEVMGFAPCTLCWYQRIAMFPLPVILGLGILFEDRKSILYAFPFAIAGLLIAAYHNLLYYDFVEEALSPCMGEGISCSEQHLSLLGFIDIPLLSLLSFVLACLGLGLSLWKGSQQ